MIVFIGGVIFLLRNHSYITSLVLNLHREGTATAICFQRKC